jgi:hypothetical protein
MSDGMDAMNELHGTTAFTEGRGRGQSLGLTFNQLRDANVTRCEAVFHRLVEWSPTDWACAFAGEAGEACNVVKKLRRLDGADFGKDSPAERMRLAHDAVVELADTVIYADLLAARLGFNLGEMIRQKFNQVSEERGSTVKL